MSILSDLWFSRHHRYKYSKSVVFNYEETLPVTFHVESCFQMIRETKIFPKQDTSRSHVMTSVTVVSTTVTSHVRYKLSGSLFYRSSLRFLIIRVPVIVGSEECVEPNNFVQSSFYCFPAL